MSGLLLDSLGIQGFRAFRHLRIPRLGRVNLIVGRNNTGKSSVLEALRLYAADGLPSVLTSLLGQRGEFSSAASGDAGEGSPHQQLALEHLFHGRKPLLETTTPIVVGPLNHGGPSLHVRVGWLIQVDDETFGPQFAPADELLNVDPVTSPLVPGLIVRLGEAVQHLLPLRDLTDQASRYLRLRKPRVSCIEVSPCGLEGRSVGRLWGRIVLTDLETDVVAALRIIAPEVERISVVGGDQGGREGTALARVRGLAQPIPLSSMGDGMVRLFNLTLALLNAEDGFLLADEIESGIHYSAQADMWRLVFRVAQRLNVQVFATTHSLDCVTAFQQAAAENTDEEGILIRLQERKGEIEAVLFDEEKLGFAAQEQIEVRG
jgi:hypothetical protein